ncbi:MAG: hypothetical protein FWH35_00730 [Treponema sp.]|nr:hypothetical protein [Treponema sp.]
MSAEVSIMNADGVAMAADSATTLGYGKTYNTADKLFALSKYYPVGIMIYGSASIMGIGWEIIVKNYRNELHDRSFDTLPGYAKDFLKFLSKFPYFGKYQMKDYFESVCHNLFKIILQRFIDDLRKLYGDKEEITKGQIDDVFVKSLKEIKDELNNEKDEKHIKVDENYINAQMKSINTEIKIIFENYPISKKLVQEIVGIIKLNFRKCGWIDKYSGIVICGYGERDLFPTTYSCKVSGKLGRGLIYFEEELKKIDPNDPEVPTSNFSPWAQDDVVSTFMWGIDPIFCFNIEEKIGFTLSKITEHLPEKYKTKIPKIIELFKKYTSDTINFKYALPMLDIVDSLQKEDLTSLAEAMINLTALRLHVTPDSETVGGSVDVAYISKSDGFIWIKKKTNYDPVINMDLNQNYFRGKHI